MSSPMDHRVTPPLHPKRVVRTAATTKDTSAASSAQDLVQQHMQLLLDLQYEQAQYHAGSSSSEAMDVPMRRPDESSSLLPHNTSTPLQTSAIAPLVVPPPPPRPPLIDEPTSYENLYKFQEEDVNDVVGQGTLYFKPNLMRKDSQDVSVPIPASTRRRWTDGLRVQPSTSLSSYGALQNLSSAQQEPQRTATAHSGSSKQSLSVLTASDRTTHTDNTTSRSYRHGHHPQTDSLPNCDDIISRQQQRHEFRYVNSDLHDPYQQYDTSDDDDIDWPDPAATSRHFTPAALNGCCCLLTPVLRCCYNFWTSPALHRSFCFGGIDGLLTGSGLVAALHGLGLLVHPPGGGNHQSPKDASWLLITLCAAVGVADAVCMALSHVWTTYVVQSAAATERSTARHQLASHKAEAKTQLVDLLLARGMLKIDAMSLADTLEGYPDLLVAALVGESLTTGVTVAGGQTAYSSNNDHQPHPYSAWTAVVPPMRHSQPQLQPGFVSYGRLTEYEMMDADALQAHQVVSEAQRESTCMMLGFAIFAIVPSVVVTIVVVLMPGGAAGQDDNSLHRTTSPSLASVNVAATSDSTFSPLMQPITLVVGVLSLLTMAMGVWKSTFVHDGRHWLLFGVEAVLVLWICLAVACGGAQGLAALCLPGRVFSIVVSIDDEL